jgi:hypothetical protein
MAGRRERHGSVNARKGTLWLAVAAAMLVPSKAKGRSSRSASTGPRDDAPQRQGRRRGERPPQVLRPVASPCGRHVAEVIGGSMFIDGRRVRASEGSAFVLAPPTWRRDGGAVAWIERRAGQARLVVVPGVDDGSEPLPWTLPVVTPDDRVFWAGQRRVVVGPEILAPRAIASWTE